uniref:Transposase n=1 Tax=Methylobacterium oryzae CBMB20 TaxID=693986 RepID=A0A088B296_9HYPH|nr:hypothetical protein [Methylobacterium oryzae]AGO88270.1 Transposase [Methylobacterium oryzae CBMB20]
MTVTSTTPFGGIKTEVVIRKYGLLQPTNWAEDCESEMRLMDDLWNKLVYINDEYISKYISLMCQDKNFSEAKSQYDNSVAASAAVSDIASSKRRLAIIQKDVARRMADALRALETSRREEVKVARQESGLWWGNYNALVRSFERARSAAIRGGQTMHRRSGGGDGRITNTLQGGAAVEALFDGSLSQIMVRPISARAWLSEIRGERRRLQRTFLSATVFVRDGERRTVTWPMIMHRPIPANCRVKEVIITRRRHGNSWRWAASFICTQQADRAVPEPTGAKRIAIDVGWRRVPDGLRVATVVISGQSPSFIVLPASMLVSFSLIDELRSRLQASNRLGIDMLQRADLGSFAQPFQDLLRDFQSISEKRPVDLAKFCESDFFLLQARENVGMDLWAWRKGHKRLTDWLRNHHRKTVGHRNHFYQNKIIEVLDQASEVIVNDVKVGEIAARRTSRSESPFVPNRVGHYRRIAAPSELIRALKLQAEKRKIAFNKLEAESPVRCPTCGSLSRKTRADALPQVCANCDSSFDQDVVACESLLSPAPTARTTRSVKARSAAATT